MPSRLAAAGRSPAPAAPRPARARAGGAPRPARRAAPAVRPGWCAAPRRPGAAAPPRRPGGLRGGAGQRLDAAHAGGDRALADDLEQADVAGAADMRAAAQLDREGRAVAVAGRRPSTTTRTSSPYFSPNSASAPSATARPGSTGACRTSALSRMRSLTSASIARDVLGRQRLRMAEVEAQPVGRDQRALLRHMLAEPAAQRLVQQVRDRMVGAQPPPALAVDPQLDRVADPERAVRHACRDGRAARRPS